MPDNHDEGDWSVGHCDVQKQKVGLARHETAKHAPLLVPGERFEGIYPEPTLAPDDADGHADYIAPKIEVSCMKTFLSNVLESRCHARSCDSVEVHC